MKFEKATWQTDGDHVNVSMPFAKIDKENRLVSGWATLDNVDRSDDVVLASASVEAFKSFSGNIREMHEPIAAGRLVSFKEDSFYDSITKSFYSGIWVTVYVSKGAQSTWEKVLDGTLTGFSIGGNITDQESQFVKDAGNGGKTVRFIKAYTLVELSLVDAPCNQLATVFSITKSQGVSFAKGMVTDTSISNVFYCSEDGLAKASKNESETCLACGKSMEVISWFEQVGDNETTKVQEVVTKFLRQKEDNAVTKHNDANGEGGVKMTDKNKTDETTADVVTSDAVDNAEEVNSTVDPNEATGSDEVVDAQEETGNPTDAEKAALVEETPGDPNLEKMFDGLRDSVNKTLEANREAVEKAVSSVDSKVAEVTKAFEEKTAGFEKAISEIREGLEANKAEREAVEKRLAAVEGASAIKKSGEVETSPENNNLKKGLWSGTFFE